MMMKNYDESVEINNNPNWPYIGDHLYRILIIGVLGSGKTNMLLNKASITRSRQNLVVHQISAWIKVSITYQWKIIKIEINYVKNSKAFNDYSQAIDDVYGNLEDIILQRKETC